MDKILEALRQIESRRPPARRPEPIEPEIEPRSPVVTEVVSPSESPAAAAEADLPELFDLASEESLAAEVESLRDITSPEELQLPEEFQLPDDVEPREIDWPELTIPPEEFVSTLEPAGRSGEAAADPRYVALAETILSRLPADGNGAFLLAGLDDPDVGGALRPLFPLLAERTPGRTIVVECNDACRAFARGDGDAALAPPGADETFWARAVFRSSHPRLDLLLGVDASKEDVPAPWIEPDALLDELRRAYQLVVLVAAPPSDLDIVSLAGACDGVYLVVRLGQTPRRRAGQVIRALQRSGAQVLGSLLLER
jgi:hypothetical protein